ncbi:Transcription elongation factor GreA [bioreactor metagenome]|uniref:Transcription elongation factor GreA n=1 Tax=bioreactor metagenome TaxID=1076179 RepID=A0A645C8G0_9ZZZZ|nr:transcription elongation factor GreA [Erysipelotrichaceae bacterium]
MAKEKILVTQEGLNELIKERDHLIHVVRPEVKEDLVAARAQGDLSENADYDAAREKQGKIEARIIELDSMLSNYELIDENKGSKHFVKLGSTVKILDMGDKTEETYTIVGSVEADPLNGKLSNVTQLAAAIMDHKEGDVVTVDVSESYKVKILQIS